MTSRREVLHGLALGLVAGFLVRDLDLTTLVSFWGDRLLIAPLGGLVGVACWNTRLRKPFAGAVAALAVLWMAVAYGPVARMLMGDLVRVDPLHPSDAVLVLSSSVQDDGDPTGVQLARLYRGLELIDDNLAPRLMITELPAPWGQQEKFAQAMLARFRPDAQLVVLRPVRNTHDEAQLALDYLRRNGLRSIIVTTSPTHTRRAGALFEGQGIEVMTTPAIETRYDLENLPRAEDRLAAWSSVIHERLGLFVYRRRGWIR